MTDGDRDAILTLLLTPGLGPTLIGRAVAAFGSAEAAVGASAEALSRVDGIGRSASKIKRAIDEVRVSDALAQEKRLIDEHRVHLVAIDDDNYPALLRHIHDPPPVLYVRGELRATDAVALAIVGARRCSLYGREQADRFAAACSQAGLCIVSGGAYGVDAAAHRATLRVEGRTIAVLGSGLARPYPADHVELFDAIADDHGAVVSELPMTIPPKAENFPRRNRIVSGMALGVLVIEASNRSGALITARLASEEHNREVMALPGRVDSKYSEGCHRIIREGWATLVTNAADVLDALGETGALLKAGVTRGGGDADRAQPADRTPSLFEQNLTDTQQRIVAALEGPVTLDQLSATTGLAMSTVQADVTMLQIRGLLGREGMMVVRKR